MQKIYSQLPSKPLKRRFFDLVQVEFWSAQKTKLFRRTGRPLETSLPRPRPSRFFCRTEDRKWVCRNRRPIEMCVYTHHPSRILGRPECRKWKKKVSSQVYGTPWNIAFSLSSNCRLGPAKWHEMSSQCQSPIENRFLILARGVDLRTHFLLSGRPILEVSVVRENELWRSRQTLRNHFLLSGPTNSRDGRVWQ